MTSSPTARRAVPAEHRALLHGWPGVTAHGLIGLAWNRLAVTPTGLVPQLDRGYFIAAFSLPPGATLERTDAAFFKGF